MAAFPDASVLPHGPLVELAENLRVIEGALPGLPLRRRMTLARLSDGRLLVHNAIALPEALMGAIEAWGRPAVLVVPNGWHRLDAKAYKRRYPQLRVVCPAGSAARVAQTVPVDDSYSTFVGDESVRLEHLDGVGEREGVLTVRSADGLSLVFNDILFNQPHLAGPRGWLLRLLGSTGGPRVTAISRLWLVKHRAALRAHLLRLAALEGLRRVIVMHGEPEHEQPAALLRAVAAGL
ncbi:MAG: hypothetical protein IPL40_06265 [Proteobacteria bacterium]|nr:hypothetical protein [Pseudomonadota bacterium]